jgi:hypothetical protein
MADDFIPYKAEKSAPPADFIPYEATTAPAAPKTVSQTPQSVKPVEKNPFAMIGEGEETQAAGNAAAAPAVVPTFAAEGGTMLGGPGAGAAAYLGTKSLMDPQGVKTHPIRTAVETGSIAAGPYVVGKAAEYLNPAFQRLASGAGEMWKYLTTPAIKAAPEAEAAIAPAVAAVPARVPAVAAPTPGPPLTNRQIAAKIVSTVKTAAGTTDQTPIYPRSVRGTVGAQTVGESPAIEIPAPRIQTPSRNETMLENLKNRVPGSNPLERKIPVIEQPASPARTPAQVNEETVHPMDRQFIHVNGSRLLDTIKDKPELAGDLLDLEGNQIREVLRKSGEDMSGIQSVGKSAGKAARGGRIADPTNLSRQEAFDILLDKGYTPEQILKEAPPRSRPAPTRVPFGPPRVAGPNR